MATFFMWSKSRSEFWAEDNQSSSKTERSLKDLFVHILAQGRLLCVFRFFFFETKQTFHDQKSENTKKEELFFKHNMKKIQTKKQDCNKTIHTLKMKIIETLETLFGRKSPSQIPNKETSLLSWSNCYLIGCPGLHGEKGPNKLFSSLFGHKMTVFHGFLLFDQLDFHMDMLQIHTNPYNTSFILTQ